MTGQNVKIAKKLLYDVTKTPRCACWIFWWKLIVDTICGSKVINTITKKPICTISTHFGQKNGVFSCFVCHKFPPNCRSNMPDHSLESKGLALHVKNKIIALKVLNVAYVGFFSKLFLLKLRKLQKMTPCDVTWL